MAGYAKLSNDFWQDKDVLKLRRRNPSAALLYVMAISWCSDHSSDGLIAEDELLYVLNASDEDVNDLVASGLLLEPSEATKGKYAIRNYLKYQNSAKQIEQAKTKATERQRRKRERDADMPVTDADNEPVTGMSEERPTSVTPVSRRDNQGVTPMSFNQEPITNNQKDFSNEKSLPQTPSQAEGPARRIPGGRTTSKPTSERSPAPSATNRPRPLSNRFAASIRHRRCADAATSGRWCSNRHQSSRRAALHRTSWHGS